MTQCIKNQQTKKQFLVLNQKCAKKIKRCIENNLNRNADTVSLRFFCIEGVLKNFIIFREKHLSQIKIVLLASTLQFIKKDVFQHKCFPMNFAKFLRTPLL